MKTIRQTMYLIILVSIIAVATIMEVVRAANYQVLFNNVEQGSNSTANPTLSVNSDGKATKTQGMQTTAQTVPQAEAETETETETQILVPQAVATTQTLVEEFTYKKMRMMFLGIAMDRNLRRNSHPNSVGGMLEFTYFPMDSFGMSLFGGAGSKKNYFYGAELDLVPLKISLFDMKNFVELTGLMGISSLGKEINTKALGHIGGRLSVNFGERYGLTASYRTNITERSRYRMQMADLGYLIRF